MFLSLSVIVATSLYFVYKWREKKSTIEYWEKLGIPFLDISKIASTFELLFGLKNVVEIDIKVYEQMGEQKFCGIIEAGTPHVIVKNLDLAKDILIKDFDNFVDRMILFGSSKSSVLRKMLPSLSGAEWRGTRMSVSPTFTTGKMRRLMDYFNSCGVEWTETIQKSPDLQAFDIYLSSGQYAIDVIATAVFGLQAGCIKDPNSVFFQKAHDLFIDTSWVTMVKQSLALRFPRIFKLLNLDAMDNNAIQFFDEILDRTLKAREKGEVGERNDFIQMLVEARKGLLKRDVNEELSTLEKEAMLNEPSNEKIYLNDDEIVKGQGFIFFFAGYHGVALTITYGVHCLAHHPDIQERVRKELEGKFNEDGSISYDDLNSLVYMDMFVTELLRFYPITPRLSRIAGRDYNRPDIGLAIPAGVTVEIPLVRIHRDPKFFPNPEKFNPENFNAENKAKRHPYAYMPFGVGPRFCIGMRFALVEVKTAIAHIVHKFKIEPVPSSPFPIKTKLVGHGFFISEDVAVKLTPLE